MGELMAQNRDGMPTAKRIHEYWYKFVVEDQDAMYALLGGDSVTNILVGKAEECYACGHKARLQKCHIIPHGCGGDEGVENLFLMCLRCHQDNPDTIYPDLFYKYVREKESHINSAFDAIVPYMLSSVEECSVEERATVDAFVNLPVGQQMAHHRKIDSESLCTGMNNRMSFNSLLGGIWKNILKYDVKLKPQPSLSPA
jgi:hypothetical protein